MRIKLFLNNSVFHPGVKRTVTTKDNRFWYESVPLQNLRPFRSTNHREKLHYYQKTGEGLN
jgi:hypothetical protein